MFPQRERQRERERRKGVKTITMILFMYTECNKEINILVQKGMVKTSVT
jgi:hypothetical protein